MALKWRREIEKGKKFQFISGYEFNLQFCSSSVAAVFHFKRNNLNSKKFLEPSSSSSSSPVWSDWAIFEI